MAKPKTKTTKPTKPYGWCFDKKGNKVEVSKPMTEDEIKKLK